jgi:hypothetical protein
MRHLKRFNESILDETFIIKEVTLTQALEFLNADENRNSSRTGVPMTEKDKTFLNKIFPYTDIEIRKCVANIIYRKKFLLRKKWDFTKLILTKFDDNWYLAYTRKDEKDVDKVWICDDTDGLRELSKKLKK